MNWIENPYDKLMPRKRPFSKELQNEVKEKALKILKREFDSNINIKKVILYGSLLDETFGIYERPTFNDRMGSDIDIMLEVDDEFKTDFKFIQKLEYADKYLGGYIHDIHWIQILAFNPKTDNPSIAEKHFLPPYNNKVKFEVLFERK